MEMLRTSEADCQTEGPNVVEKGCHVHVTRGNYKGTIAWVGSVYDLSSGRVAQVVHNDGSHGEYYTSILQVVPAPRTYLRRSQNGEYGLVSHYEPKTGELGILEIRGEDYEFLFLPTPKGVKKHFKCTRVTGKKPTDPDGYDVTFHADGSEDCTCGDYVYRSGPNGERCKHLKAFVEMFYESIRPALRHKPAVAVMPGRKVFVSPKNVDYSHAQGCICSACVGL